MRFDSAAIAAATGGVAHGHGSAGAIETDTRKLGPGTWFLAIVGERFDGHDFVDAAAASGAVGGVFSRPPGPAWRLPWVEVDDTTVALQHLARAARRRLVGPVVGITGSSGKTTTRALTALALSPLGEVHQTVGNLNNHYGVPMSLLAAPVDAAACVIEMGTSSPGEIALLADIATPDVRVVVNVGPAHLLELGGLEGVAREKRALLESAAAGDVVVLNLDDPFLRTAPSVGRVVTWGRDAEATIRLLDAVIDPASLTTLARFDTPAGALEVRLPVPGEHVAHDAAAALAVAWALGVDLTTAVARLADYAPVGMRLRARELPGGVVAINDAYNANPQSTYAALAVLAALGGRRIAVLGDMLELGADEALWHARVAAEAGRLGLEHVVLVGPRMAGAAEACVGAGLVEAFEEAEGVGERLAVGLRPGDKVLFKGSRGARMERVLEAVETALGDER